MRLMDCLRRHCREGRLKVLSADKQGGDPMSSDSGIVTVSFGVDVGRGSILS